METISAKKYLITNAKSTIFRVGISTISTFVIIPFIIKNIGLINYSYVSITSFFVTFAGLFDIGLSKSLVYLLNNANEDSDKKNQYITAVRIINLAIISLILLIGFGTIFGGVNILGKNISQDNQYFTVIVSSSIIILVLSLYNMYQSALLESYFMLEHNNYGMMVKIMSLNALYFFNLITINDTTLYILSPILSVLFTAIYYSIIIRKNIEYKHNRPTKDVWKSVVSHSFEFFKIGILTSVNSALPNLCLIYLGNNVAYVGVLDVISKISFSIINLFSTISKPLYALSRKKPQIIKKKMPLILSIYACVGLAFLTTVFLFRGYITSYFFSSSVFTFSFIQTILIIYITGYAIQLLSQPLSQYLMGIGKYKHVAKSLLTNTIVFITVFSTLRSYLEINILVTLSIINLLISITYTASLYIRYKK